MKKIVAILLIAILFFNWYGYQIVTTIMAQNADKRLELQLDNNDYDESQLVEVRIPMNIPYQTEQSSFERHYGEVKVNGKYYQYVKRKVEKGYLVLQCIPNNSKESIKAAGNEFFKMANGLDQDQAGKKQNNNTNLAKNFNCEYDGRETDFTVNVNIDLISNKYLDNTSSLQDMSLSTPGQPPECIA